MSSPLASRAISSPENTHLKNMIYKKEHVQFYTPLQTNY